MMMIIIITIRMTINSKTSNKASHYQRSCSALTRQWFAKYRYGEMDQISYLSSKTAAEDGEERCERERNEDKREGEIWKKGEERWEAQGYESKKERQEKGRRREMEPYEPDGSPVDPPLSIPHCQPCRRASLLLLAWLLLEMQWARRMWGNWEGERGGRKKWDEGDSMMRNMMTWGREWEKREQETIEDGQGKKNKPQRSDERLLHSQNHHQKRLSFVPWWVFWRVFELTWTLQRQPLQFLRSESRAREGRGERRGGGEERT